MSTTLVQQLPETYKQAINSADAEHWKAAMNAEVSMLIESDTWKVTPLSPERAQIKRKWGYTMKQDKQENEVTYKARCVVKGYSLIHGVDYDETFPPITRFTTIRMLLQKATNKFFYLYRMNVKGAPIDRDIYVQQPEGYEQTVTQAHD